MVWVPPDEGPSEADCIPVCIACSAEEKGRGVIDRIPVRTSGNTVTIPSIKASLFGHVSHGTSIVLTCTRVVFHMSKLVCPNL